MLLQRLATPALALLLAGPALASEPAPLRLEPAPLVEVNPAVSNNQRVADAIVARLRSSGQLRNYRIDVTCQGRTVILDGQVADGAQRDEAARLTQGMPGVERVLNRLQVPGGDLVRPTQFTAPAELPAAEEPLPPPRKVEAGSKNLPPEPLPSFRAPPPHPDMASSQPPFMPPYAWPTYAPYNNYSRVAYPSQYPYEAFPKIGPFYPFPKVPLGWRSVNLEWNDGHWYMSTHSQKRDWWSIRYW